MSEDAHIAKEDDAALPAQRRRRHRQQPSRQRRRAVDGERVLCDLPTRDAVGPGREDDGASGGAWVCTVGAVWEVRDAVGCGESGWGGVWGCGVE